MTLRIGTNIRTLRTARGLTQERLAEHLGVSCQAVSKWESGSGYSDIEFIPALAYYFNTTTDELLGVDMSRNREIIDGYLKKYFELSQELPAQLALMREAVAAFPNNFLLLQGLMYALVFNVSVHQRPEPAAGMLTKSTVLEEEANRGLINEAVAIAERILKACTDDGIRHSAIQILCYYYPLLDRTEEAVLLAKSMPPLYITRDGLLEEIYTGEDKIRQIQLNIYRMTDLLCSDIVSMADPDGQQRNNIAVDEKIQLIETANSIYRLVCDDGHLTLYRSRLAHNCRLMAALALLEGQTEKALGYLEQAADYAIAADNKTDTAPLTGLAVNRLTEEMLSDSRCDDGTAIVHRMFHEKSASDRIVLKIDHIDANQAGFLLKKLEQGRYDAIRNSDRFKAITARLRQHA